MCAGRLAGSDVVPAVVVECEAALSLLSSSSAESRPQGVAGGAFGAGLAPRVGPVSAVSVNNQQTDPNTISLARDVRVPSPHLLVDSVRYAPVGGSRVSVDRALYRALLA